jgi:hypothetical protein
MTASALDASHTILHNSIMKRSPVIGVVPQFFMIIGIAFARDDAPPSPVTPWAPPALPRYEGELRHYKLNDAERRYYPAIDAHKTYNLAELIDIAQRSNPETRVAWQRARMAAAAVGLTESAYLLCRWEPSPFRYRSELIENIIDKLSTQKFALCGF